MPTSHSFPAKTFQAAAHPEGLPQPPQRVQSSPDMEPGRSASSSPGFPDHASSYRRRRPETWVCTCSASSLPGPGFAQLSCA